MRNDDVYVAEMRATRISLRLNAPRARVYRALVDGSAATWMVPVGDMRHGRFVKLVPDEQVVQALEFETTDPALRGEMTVSFTLVDAEAGRATDVVAVHDRLPPGLSAADNETGWRMSLAKLAALVEA
jgi:uncharacterized protein YndB with AHSA1/START domain